jgi:hypothetical protein
MIRTLLLATAIACATVAAAAETEEQITRECVAEIERQAGCTSACVNKTWPEVARCVNARKPHHFPAERLDVCIRQVQTARVASRTSELVGDPVGEAFACVGH